MPFWPPENFLNRIERMLQQAGYDVITGGDYTAKPPMRVVRVGDEEIARAADREQLAVITEKWLEANGPAKREAREFFCSGGEW